MAARKREKGKLSGLKADGSPNAYWVKFKERLRNYKDAPVKDWTAENILGLILNHYQNTFGLEWGLSHSGAPTKCSEMYCVKRMILTLGTEDFSIVKDYVDWIFEKQIKPKKINITSLGFFFTASLISQFKKEYRRDKLVITRTTPLPSEIEKEISEFALDNINTYGDLAFAHSIAKDDPTNNMAYVVLFTTLREKHGFDEGILERL